MIPGHLASYFRPKPSIQPKNDLLIPFRLALALQDDGWIVRQPIIWEKPAPMPESVTDRCTTSHEYILMLAKADRYYFDALAIAEPSTYPDDDRKARSTVTQKRMPSALVAGIRPGSAVYPTRNARTVWTINGQPFSAARLGVVGAEHYAAFPPDLPRRCIAAGTSDKGVCPNCSAPWARVVERSVSGARHVSPKDVTHPTQPTHATARLHGQYFDSRVASTGWAPTCACADPRPPVPATVLDPFFGSGTTGKVATAMGRACVGIELNSAYIPILAARNAQAGMGFFDDEGAAS